MRRDGLHSVSLGQFRLPQGMYKTMHKLYPDEKLLAYGLEEKDGMVSYQPRLGRKGYTTFARINCSNTFPPSFSSPVPPPPYRFDMRVLVTGASSRHWPRASAKNCSPTVIAPLALPATSAKFPCDDRRFEAHSIDLGRPRSNSPPIYRTLVATYPALDALVLNAGVGRFGTLEQFSYDQIRALIDLNFTSHVFVARAFLPSLKKGGRMDTWSLWDRKPHSPARAQGSLYCAAKFALRGLAQALRAECARAGVRVTLVNPRHGPVALFSPNWTSGPAQEPDNYILPEDVAEVIVQALTARDGTVLDEINLSPQKKSDRVWRAEEKVTGASCLVF